MFFHNLDGNSHLLNQVTKKSDDNWKTQSDYTYDNRGNLIQETYTKNNKVTVTGAYTYDETNKMVLGINDLGESSAYLYNGLGALVENTWVIKKNAYSYHDVSALTTMVDGELVVDRQTGKKDKKDKLDPEVVAASPTLNKTSTVVKQFVVDYTSETFEPLMEYEVNGLDYRYVYGNDRLSVDVKGITSGAGSIIENGDHIRLYYHMDYLGTADYLTSPVSLKVESWTHYNEWGEISHNAVLMCGQRELDLVKRYATHDYDSVLDMYYAKARFYDAGDRRFVAIDPILDVSKYDIKDYVKNPVELVQYLYVQNNPVIYIDIDGLRPVKGDTDLVGAYLKKQKETQRRIEYNINYRQEHSVMFLDGIAPTEAALISKLDLYKAKDYNEKIKKCEEKIISDMLPNDGREYFIVTFETISADKAIELQTRYHNAKTPLAAASVLADMAKYTWSIRYNNARSYYIIGTGGNPVAGDAFDTSMVYLIGSQVSYVAGQVIKGLGKIAEGAGSKTTESLTSLYRAVGPDEFYNVMKTGEFSVIPNGLQAKQFGLSFEETLKFADKYSDIGAIIEVKVPTSVLNKIGDFTQVDKFIFKNGTVTIQADKLGDFNKIIQELIHKY